MNNDDVAMAGVDFSADDVTNTTNNIDIDNAVVDDDDDAGNGIDFDDAVIDFALLDNVHRNQICQKVMSILQQREKFPSQQQETVVQFAQQLLKNVKHDVKDMITNQWTEGEGYNGLDSNIDTEVQVSTALGFYSFLVYYRNKITRMMCFQFML